MKRLRDVLKQMQTPEEDDCLCVLSFFYQYTISIYIKGPQHSEEAISTLICMMLSLGLTTNPQA